MDILAVAAWLLFTHNMHAAPVMVYPKHPEPVDGAVLYWKDGKQILDVYTPKCIHRFKGVNTTEDGDEAEGEFNLNAVLDFPNYQSIELFYSCGSESHEDIPYPVYPPGQNRDFNTLKATE